MRESRARALVVEDDRAWREILGELLGDMGLEVDRVDGYVAAVQHLRATPYRVAVVDLSLSSDDYQDRQGQRVLEAVRAYAPGCTSILLTGFATVELAVSALMDYGAYSCLRKETFRRAEFRELLARALASPSVPHAPQHAREQSLGFASPGLAAPAAGQAGRQFLARLTPREHAVLELLVQGHTNKGIAHALVISTNTVKRYLKSIFEKLEVDSRAAAVARALGGGGK